MDDRAYDVTSYVLVDLQAENVQLEAMIAQCRSLIVRTEQLIEANSKRIEQEEKKLVQLPAQFRKKPQLNPARSSMDHALHLPADGSSNR